jgi:hypothetical protein
VLVFAEHKELGGGQGVEGQGRLVKAKVAQEVLEGKEEVIYTSLIRPKRFYNLVSIFGYFCLY